MPGSRIFAAVCRHISYLSMHVNSTVNPRRVRGADMGADRPVAASSTSVEATAHRIAYALLRPIAFYPQVPPLLSGAADLECAI